MLQFILSKSLNKIKKTIDKLLKKIVVINNLFFKNKKAIAI